MANTATVSGTFKNPDNSAAANASVVFTPIGAPFISGTDIIALSPITATLNGSGELSQVLVEGQYRVTFGTTSFLIDVPSSGTPDIKDIVSEITTATASSALATLRNSGALGSIMTDGYGMQWSPRGDVNRPALRVAAVAGTGAGSGDTNAVAVANVINTMDPQFILLAGNYNPGGAAGTIATLLETHYSNWLSGLASTFRIYPAVADADNNADDWSAHKNYFDLPGSETYYKKTFGDGINESLVDLFVINSSANETDGNTNNSTQAQWLQTQLAASTAIHKIVMFFDAPAASKAAYANTQMATWDLAGWGADMVICGGPNFYERFSIGGIPYFIVGTGGLTLDTLTYPVTNSQYQKAEFGSLMLDITEHSIKTFFVETDGAVSDSKEWAASNRPNFYGSPRLGDGLKISGYDIVPDFGGGPRIPHQFLDQTPDGALTNGAVLYAPTIGDLPDMVQYPELRRCIFWVGDDPPAFYCWNPQSKTYVSTLTVIPTVALVTPANAKCAAPSITPNGGRAEGFSLTDNEGTATLYYSVNNGLFTTVNAGDDVIFTKVDAYPRYVKAFARKAGTVDSDIVTETFT